MSKLQIKTKIKTKIKQKKNGSGLVEVLVALAILSMTMITVVSVTAASLRRIKQDEIEDRAIGIQFRALELVKSPVSDLGLGTMQTGDIGFYSLSPSGSDSTLVKENGSTVISAQNCDTSSDYYVNLADLGYVTVGNTLLCNQVIVEFLGAQEGLRTYKVRSLLVYNNAGEIVFNELVGYRREKTI